MSIMWSRDSKQGGSDDRTTGLSTRIRDPLESPRVRQ
jgi:hypothetical protein